ncbi:MAG: glutamine-hydrolyzing carbamoyl-phosphate synthase small subunit [Verrucomicrobiaceae bacterium]|nr:glutamine-hydrolyzing carbamoyl-phosphate synthase small subunit [Verrucomicrobiaceae bacterium]
MRALLALEDGRTFEGTAFGASGTATGEACFNTSMTGYQEVLTDPSYRGQIVAMTVPQIGNYGINHLDDESSQPQVRGFVIEELSPVVSNWRSEQDLDSYLKQWNIPGIQGVDTRALTKHLRTRGAMRAVITSQVATEAEAVRLAQESPTMEGSDYVKEVTATAAYKVEDSLAAPWTIPSPSQKLEGGPEGVFLPLPEAKHRIVAFDFGVKRNILRCLRQSGFEVQVVPATTSAEDVLRMNPDGIFLSNGPGDPAALGYIHQEVKQLIGKKPIFAICLGHQILGHVCGGRTFKLKFGHRGGNQPVKDLRSGKVAITSQNHGFAVDPSSLPGNVQVTHINLNDGTVEGIRYTDHPVFSVQYHPEAAPGPNDARYFFAEFAKLIEETR